MPRLRVLSTGLACLLVFLAAAGPVQAEDSPAPGLLGNTLAALDALDVAQEALATGEGDVSMALAGLSQALPDLPADRRSEAQSVLARPDGENGSSLDIVYGGNWPLTDRLAQRATCKEGTTPLPFCVHWIPSGGLLQSRHASTATEVQQTIDILQQVWRTEVGTLGYLRPAGDGTDGNPGNEDRLNLVDVYLSDLDGYLGYAVCESGSQHCPGYLVLENDFGEFAFTGRSAIDLRRVTAAHEFFHLIQYAYDSHESPWLMESSANWMEERVYDSVNDNRSFIRYGSLSKPRLPLSTTNGAAEYGGWVFHELYTQPYGVGTMRAVWQRAAQVDGPNWRTALQGALASRGTSFQAHFRNFGAASNVPARRWSEGSAYPTAALTASWTLTGGGPSTGLRSTTLKGFSSSNYRLVPGSALTGDWKLRVVVDTPGPSIGTGSATVFYRDGRVVTVPLRLNAAGDGSGTVAFRAGTVSRVILNVGNAASGDRGVRFRATAFR